MINDNFLDSVAGITWFYALKKGNIWGGDSFVEVSIKIHFGTCWSQCVFWTNRKRGLLGNWKYTSSSAGENVWNYFLSH